MENFLHKGRQIPEQGVSETEESHFLGDVQNLFS